MLIVAFAVSPESTLATVMNEHSVHTSVIAFLRPTCVCRTDFSTLKLYMVAEPFWGTSKKKPEIAVKPELHDSIVIRATIK